jgi:hypothetical protein
MKDTRWVDSLFSSGRVRRGNPADHRRDESLFSLLLKMESRLRAGAKEGLEPGSQQRNFMKMKVPKRSRFSNLSRYIE